MKLLKERYYNKDKLKSFLAAHEELLNSGDIKELYDEAPIDLYFDLTIALKSINIDPLIFHKEWFEEAIRKSEKYDFEWKDLWQDPKGNFIGYCSLGCYPWKAYNEDTQRVRALADDIIYKADFQFHFDCRESKDIAIVDPKDSSKLDLLRQNKINLGVSLTGYCIVDKHNRRVLSTDEDLIYSILMLAYEHNFNFLLLNLFDITFHKDENSTEQVAPVNSEWTLCDSITYWTDVLNIDQEEEYLSYFIATKILKSINKK